MTISTDTTIYALWNPVAPVFTPEDGTTFDDSLSVSISCPTEGATIYYTTDGSEPTIESPVYRRFRIYGKTTVKAIAEKDGMLSEVVTAEYALGRCVDPIISLVDGTEFAHSNQTVSIRWKNDGVLRYTQDGSDPTTESPIYEGSFTVNDSVVVKAKVFSEDFFDSAVVTSSLTRVWEHVATPAIEAETSFSGSKAKVVISCATRGALIYYTLNGDEPDSSSLRYTGPLYVTDSCAVKAYAAMPDYLDSATTAQEITKVWSIGDTMGKPDHGFTTDGNTGWTRVVDATAPNGEAMKSGAITHNQSSVLSTTVMGPGTLSFSWRTSCEDDPQFEWDHAECAVDGTVVRQLCGVTAWTNECVEIVGDGEHTVEWRYVKDEVESAGEDAAWVANYQWTSAWTATRTTEVPVPYAWLTAHDPDVVDEYDAYEASAKTTAVNGHKTWECYVLGLDPQGVEAFRIASFPMKADGTPDWTNVAFDPPQEQWNVPDAPVVWKGATQLEGPWRTVTMEGGSPGMVRPTMQFFKAVVFGDAHDGVQLWEGGPYWAECNVGASKPEEYGYYFWWGDTVGYTNTGSGWISVKNGTSISFTDSGTASSTYGKDNSALLSAGYIDSAGNLAPEYDAAHVHWGGEWRMPTDAEFSALISNCTTTWITTNGVSGRLVKGKDAYANSSIFLPAAGGGLGSDLSFARSFGYYWSSSPYSVDSFGAWGLGLGSSSFDQYGGNRDDGRSVRPVRGCAK